MNQTQQKLITLPFGAFIEKLKGLGFSITIDHYIKVKGILSQPMTNRSLDHIKYITCPLFATSEDQQLLYYKAFDEFFTLFDQSKHFSPWTPKHQTQTEHVPLSQDRTSIKKWPYIVSGMIIFILIIISLLLLDTYKSQSLQVPKPVNVVSPQIPQVSEPVDIGSEPVKGQPYDLTPLNEPTTEPPKQTIEPAPFDWKQARLPRYGILLTLALCLILIELYRYNRQKMVLQKQRGKKPPITWPIQVPPQSMDWIKIKQFYAIARHLRNRLFSDIYQLDIIRTIDKTIESSGFPQFHYALMTRPSEYLVLIDMPDYQNQLTHYMAQLMDVLANEGIFITRYFYKEDPQVCFQDSHTQRYRLEDIQHKYKDCRLIVIGTGDLFLNPVTGQPDQWLNIFYFWPERAFVTPRPVNQWGHREHALMAFFPLFPGTLEGLEQLSIHFDMSEQRHDMEYQTECAYGKPIAYDEEDCDRIEQSIHHAPTFQWLCACAVYPELNWNLTLYLGGLILKDSIHEKQIHTLLRLPWFQTGSIPDKLRVNLIHRLSKDNTTLVRKGIIHILEENPPPKDAIAYDTYRLSLSVQWWMLSLLKNKQFRKTIKNTPCHEDRIAKDFTLIRMIDDLPKSPLSFVLPNYLKKLFFRNAIILFGMKASIRLFIAFGIAMLLLMAASLPDIAVLKNYFVQSTSLEIETEDQSGVDTQLDQQRNMELEERDMNKDPVDASTQMESIDAAKEITPIKTIDVIDQSPEKKSIEKEKEVVETGRLFVHVIPEKSIIRIPSIKASYTPGMNLKPGTYKVVVTSKGYISHEQTIRITSNKDTKIDIQLDPLAQLTVTTHPNNATVRIMNINPKYYPGIELMPGRYHIQVTQAGYLPDNQWIELAAGDAKELSITLTMIEQKIQQKEQEQQQDTSTRFSPIKLRSTLTTLSEDDVKTMIKKYNFYDNRWNPEGNFANDYVKKQDKGIVIDRRTGLMWQQSGSNNLMTYDSADKYIQELNQRQFAGYSDWRLPTLEELTSLLENKQLNKDLYIDPVFDNDQWWCWTSDKRSSSSCWVVDFNYGYVYWYDWNLYYVRAVRFGQ